MSCDNLIRKAVDVIGEALNIEPDDFADDETWAFLGAKGLLAAAIAADLRAELRIDVAADDFVKHPTVGKFKIFLHDRDQKTTASSSDAWGGIPKPKVPLSIILQNHPSTCKTTLFLFPDGSGSGASYASLPPVSKDVCLVGLNSPFLRQAREFTCSVERMARLWFDEVCRLQPAGRPFILGGWSAGEYYAYEMARLLIAAGKQVERLILIDSPCRLQFEALPAQVVEKLTKKGLMGASGEKKAPEWLVQHFTSTVVAVDRYMPTPMAAKDAPSFINFAWVRKGLVKSVPESGLEVDMNVKVTKFLLEPRGDLQTEGWEILLPGAKYSFDYMSGNHFQITQPPHVSR